LWRGAKPQTGLWIGLGVAGGAHVKADHHGVIFVNHVVAMDHVASQPVAEAHPDGCIRPWHKADRVFARLVHAGRSVGGAPGPAILATPAAVVGGIIRAAAIETGRALRDLVLFHVHMDRVRPVPPIIEIPLLHGVLLHGEARGGATEQTAVDGPLTVASLIEVEAAGHTGRAAYAWQGVEARQGYRVYAVVRCRRLIDHDLQHQEALASTNHRSRRTALAVRLVQTVFDVDGLARILLEIDDYVRTLSDSQRHRRNLDRLRQQVAVIGDLPERLRRRRAGQVGQVELQEARWAGVDPTETIAPRAHVQHRLDHAIHQELVAQDAIGVEGIEYQVAGGGVKATVGKHHRDVIGWERGQPEAGGFIAGIGVVEQNVVPHQPFIWAPGMLQRMIFRRC
jgi:hypothetical protein